MDLSGWLVIVAVILIAALYAYRSRKQAQALEQSADDSKWFDHVIARLSEMSRTDELRDLDWAVDYLKTHQVNRHDSEQAKQFLDFVCAEYLTGTNQQRDAIRRLFAKDAWWPLLEYADAQARKVQSQSDVDFLRHGLAASSIAGLRIDYRDFLVCLGCLYLEAESAGINPQPYFKEVADLSDTETTDLKLSTADVIGSFHDTAYFKELRGRRDD